MTSKFFRAVFLQLSGTVGSGIFALPFLFFSSNFYLSLIILIFAFLITYIINRFYINIILATPGDHQLSGYAELYLGKKYQYLSLFTIILLAIGAIFAYEKLFFSFFKIFFPTFSYLFIFLIFFSLIALSHLSRFHLFKKISFLIPLFTLIIPAILFLTSINSPAVYVLSQDNLPFGSANLSLTFGVLLFALSGFTVLPEIEELLRDHPHKKRMIPVSSLVGLALVVLVYAIFAYSVIRLSGPHLSPDTVNGLFIANPLIGRLIAFLGLIITFQATLNFLLILRELFFRDFHLTPSLSDFLPLTFIFLPLSLFSLSFIKIISLTGAITIFFSAAIIFLIHHKIYRRLLFDILAILELALLFIAVLEELR